MTAHHATISGACPHCCHDAACTVGYDPYYVGGNFPLSDEWDVAGQCTNGMLLDVGLLTQTDPDQLTIYADGVEIWDSGCISTGPSTSWTYNIPVPAGTKTISIVLDNDCGSHSTFWLLHLLCHNIAP